MNTTPEVNINNFSPDVLLLSMAQDNWNDFWEYLCKYLDSFSVHTNRKFGGVIQTALQDDDKRKFLKAYGAMMGEILLGVLANEQAKIPDKYFKKILYAHDVIHMFFQMRGVDKTDPLIERILGNKKKLTDKEQKRICLLLSVDTSLDMDSILQKIGAKYRPYVVASYMMYISSFKKNTYNNKILLYKYKKDLEKLSDIDDINWLIAPYFSCSYLNSPDKHELKIHINKAFEKYFNKHKNKMAKANFTSPDLVTMPIDPEKPKIIFFMEVWRANHAMTRSWSKWIQSLEKYFNVLIVAMKIHEGDYDEHSYQNVLYCHSIANFAEISGYYKPDILMLPSVGMTASGVLVSNMRLAPIQMMSLGHPATSRSKHIDYVYGQSHLYHPDAFPEDTYIADNSPFRFRPYFTKEQLSEISIRSRSKDEKGPIKVAIIGSQLKTCAPFLELLQDIENICPYDIEFSFSLATVGFETLFTENYIKPMFKNAIYFGYQNYEDYMSLVAQSDIVLNPFPFGHTNTIIDTLILGKPCVGLEGIEPASRTEKYILDIVDLSDQFLAQDLDEYKAKALGLFDQIMNGETEFFDKDKVYDDLYAESIEMDFGKNIKWLYDNHKSIQDSEKKYITIFEDLEQNTDQDISAKASG